MTQFAPAKVNLFLHVTGKQDDGQHLLQSLIAFTNEGDEITISPADKFSLTLEGNVQGLDNEQNNLVTQAAKKVCESLGRTPNFSITLNKNIPVGAGLGGGSADAAATIRAILNFWNETLPDEQLNKILLSLGADVPICYTGKISLVEGIGEIIAPLSSATKIPAVLVYPNTICSTQAVFKKFNSSFSDKIELPNNLNLIDFIKKQKNDLTEAACSLFPEIKDALNIIEQQNGCEVTRMSGSGSTCFGLFNTVEESKIAAQEIQKEKPDWWVRPVLLK